MKACIFIRTFHKDAPFLVNALRSIEKYARGWDEILVHCDAADAPIINKIVAGKAKLMMSMPYSKNGYLNQQIVKLNADQMTSADMITYVDSDCVFTKETRPEDLMVNGKIQILYTPYEKVGDAICWKARTEAILGWPIGFEFMRRFPLSYYRHTLADLRRYIEKKTGQAASRRWVNCWKPGDGFNEVGLSEFNVLGAYAFQLQPSAYSWLHTEENPLPDTRMRQFWSYGGLTNEVKAETEGYLTP